MPVPMPLKGWQVLPVDTDTNLGTLATLTAVSLDGTYGTPITRAFLMKAVNYWLTLESLTTSEGPVIIGLANGTATVAEIANWFSALTVADSDDAGAAGIIAQLKTIVYAQSVIVLDGRADTVLSIRKTLGGRGSGIPVQEDTGFQLFAFNADISTLTTGARIRGVYAVEGVWLDG